MHGKPVTASGESQSSDGGAIWRDSVLVTNVK